MKNSRIKSLEKTVNAHLASLPAAKRPEMTNRSRVQSVAYIHAGAFEATDRDGHIEAVPLQTVLGWMRA
jgi:hypothetical protein